MANNLTGDFDVVAEFSIPAVNRLLAAMHQTGRFLHSISVRVDDNPSPSRPGWPTAIGVVNQFGEAEVNQQQIGNPNPFPGAASATNAIYSRLGLLVNPDRLVAAPPEIVPSHISGVAQLQLFPPTIAVPESDGASLSVTMNLMSRFFPDKGTATLAEFMRGDLNVTVPISKVVSGGIGVIDIDFRSADAEISFTPSYTSTPLTAQDIAGINLCIQNGLQTSFLPSSVVLPASIAEVQLKTLPGALTVMIDLNDHPSTSGSVTDVFLTGSDDFAFAIGRDYFLNTLNLIASNILAQAFPPVTFSVNLLFTTLHYSYPIKLTVASFDLQPPDKIVLTLQGHAGPEEHGHAPNSFSFTVKVEFSLTPSGPAVDLELGNVSVSTSSDIASILDYFTGDVTNSVKAAVENAMGASGVSAMVNGMFNADTNLGNFLSAQLNPTDGSAQLQSQQLFLVYNSIDIQTAGIVLHGSLLVFDWPAPYVEFEPIPTSSNGNPIVSQPVYQATDYSALKTWIPGGTIAQYEWSTQGQPNPFDIDPNRFVLLGSPPVIAAAVTATTAAIPSYAPLCLKITGTRISNFGSPPVYQPVTASICGYTRFPVLPGTLQSPTGREAAPMISIVRPGARGGIVVSGQTQAEFGQTGRLAPNLVVHFAGTESVNQLQLLVQALGQSKRIESPTAVIAVLTPDQMSNAPYVPSLIYAEDSDGKWQSLLNLKSAKPLLTVIVTPDGSVAWQREGLVDVAALAPALTRYLVKCPPVKLSMPLLNARIGQPAPNFLFEYAPGRGMPLSKLEGKSLTLIFWRSSVKASMQAVRDLQASSAKTKAASLVLAVNDGEDPSLARTVAAESGITAILVTDPKREISLAYGVSMWPTIVSVDANGLVAGIRYGSVSAGGQLVASGKKIKSTG